MGGQSRRCVIFKNLGNGPESGTLRDPERLNEFNP